MESDSSGHSVFPILSLLLFTVKSFGADVLGYSLLAILLMIASAVVSAAEAAYFSLRPSDLEELKNEDSRTAKDILHLRNHPRDLLSTILIANNLINICIILITYLIFEKMFEFSDYNGIVQIPGDLIEFVFTVAVTTYFLVLFAEITPKVYASQNNIFVSRATAPAIRILMRLLYPFSFLLVKSGDFLERKFKRDYSEINLEEIAEAIELAADEDTSEKEVDILKGIVHLGNKQVKQIMHPRTKISAFDLSKPLPDLLRFANECGYSRIPVFHEDLDNIRGIIHVKDLLAHMDKAADFNWRILIRKAEFVPETKKIDDLLKEIQKTGMHLVIVVDEYGGTSGLITLEDIVEEVVGDIRDEFDELSDLDFRKLDDRNFLFDGSVMLNDVYKIMDLPNDTFEEVKGEAESIAGMVIEIAGEFPQENEEVNWQNFRFVVMKRSNNHLQKIKITRLD